MTTDLKSRCRTCLTERDSYYELLDVVEENYEILEMLDSLVPKINVKKSSQFSSLLCRTCVDKLLAAYKFQQMCMKSNKHLHRLAFEGKVEEKKKLKPRIICNICQKDCRFPSKLREHMMTHSKARPILCSQCDRTFDTKRSWQYHLRSHSTEAAYSCTQCDKSFKHPSTLYRHMKAHTDLKKYQCSYCPRRFNRRGHIALHESAHVKNKDSKRLKSENKVEVTDDIDADVNFEPREEMSMAIVKEEVEFTPLTFQVTMHDSDDDPECIENDNEYSDHNSKQRKRLVGKKLENSDHLDVHTVEIKSFCRTNNNAYDTNSTDTTINNMFMTKEFSNEKKVLFGKKFNLEDGEALTIKLQEKTNQTALPLTITKKTKNL